LVAIHTSRLEWVGERLRTAQSEPRRGPRVRWVIRRDWPRAT
jgi:hypothetical protein